MKKSCLNICFFVFAFVFVFSVQLNAQKIKVTNASQFKRTEEIIEINLNKITKLNEADIEKLGVVNAGGQKRFITQLVDNELDGKYDLLLFHDDFEPGETKEYELKYFDTPLDAASKTFVSFIERRKDVAWENDRIAFRVYGASNATSGIDVWNKRVKYLIVAKWYDEDEKKISSYHEDIGEGADFFNVGNSLGCGASALIKDEKLYQAGPFSSYKIIANGPLRAKFELIYNFDAAGEKVTEKKTITLDAGSNLNKIETNYNVIPDNVDFTAGLVKRANTSVYTDKKNSIISLWGDNTTKKEDGLVGTAVILPAEGNQKITEDDKHVLVINEKVKDITQTYYTGSTWSKCKKNNTNEEWINYLTEFARKIKMPMVIEIN